MVSDAARILKREMLHILCISDNQERLISILLDLGEVMSLASHQTSESTAIHLPNSSTHIVC